MSTQVSSHEAEEALRLIEQASQRMRHMMGRGTMWAYLVIWGTVWALGFLGDQFLPTPWEGRLWFALDVGGVILSFGLGIYYGRKIQSRAGAQTGLLWLAWLAYSALIIFLAQPQSSFQVGILVTVLAMFAYVIMGIWVRSTFLSLLGLIITACALASYTLWPASFNFVMALVGVGMLASGLYMRKAWR